MVEQTAADSSGRAADDRQVKLRAHAQFRFRIHFPHGISSQNPSITIVCMCGIPFLKSMAKDPA